MRLSKVGLYRNFCFFPNKYSSRSFLRESCSYEVCGNIFILYLLVEVKVKGYQNTSTVYTKKRGKVKYSHEKSKGTILFIFAFPMINDAPVYT